MLATGNGSTHHGNGSPWLVGGQPEPLVLASASPRRQRLLAQVGLRFVQRPTEADETWPTGRSIEDGVAEIALRKAAAAADGYDDAVVLGADTAVVVDADLLGKPTSERDAVRMLSSLAGRTHQVVTGIALIDTRHGTTTTDAETTDVAMRSATGEELDRYVATGEPMDKAGAYGIQGYGAGLVTRVSGCYFNVVGLPLAKTLFHLRNIMDNRELSNV